MNTIGRVRFCSLRLINIIARSGRAPARSARKFEKLKGYDRSILAI